MRADVVEVVDSPRAWPGVVEPYRWLLQRIGDGVTLTGAGYLPPSIYGRPCSSSGGTPTGSARATARTSPFRLPSSGSDFRYDYDFGDGWEHDVRVLGRMTADGARCLDGAGACSPEDCGGAPGCERLLEVLADPAYPEHAELAGWLGRPFDPAVFDPHRADAAMQRAAGR